MLRKTSSLLALVLLCHVGQVRVSMADGPPFIAHLPQGTAELVGITSYRPTKKSRWWQADGSAAQLGPFLPVQRYHPSRVLADHKLVTFLVRFENLPAEASSDTVAGVNSATTPQRPPRSRSWIAGEGARARNPMQFFTGAPAWDTGAHLWEATCVYDIAGPGSVGASTNARSLQPAGTDGKVAYAYDNVVPYYYKMFATAFDGYARTTDLRVGVSMGEWETVARRKPDSAGTSRFTRDGREWTVTFHRARTRRSATAGDSTEVMLRSSFTYGQWNKRLVAVTDDGKEHTASIGVNSGGDVGAAVFRAVPLSSITEFQLQVRPYSCVEFKNISLQPGQKTFITVVSSADSDNGGKVN